ncbi:MAG TPA: ATP-grasp domain-containing protein [Candidatus Nitrosopolaris sp.]|nr:ATP-grasp domain-containing protein [Candidatus Nitrosopolaris sp.]
MTSTVLVPGAAGPAGINTIKSLQIAGFGGKILATDSNSLSAGFFMADINEVIPEADDHTFVDRLFQIVKKYQVEVLMPSSGFDIYPYSENRKQLAEMGAEAIVSDRDKLEICRDKMLTFQTLSNKFILPFTTEDSNKINIFPVLAKPRFGKGSRGIVKIDDESDLKYIMSKRNDLVFQEFLPGTEYTVDVLSDLNGKPLIAVPRIRMQTKAGISTKGRVLRDPALEADCMKIAEYIGIRGPCCMQMKESAQGTLKLIEVNPRMGGGTIFTSLAGANFPALLLDMIEGRQISIPTISEITIIRYFEEYVLKNEEERIHVGANLLSKTRFQV